MPILFFIYPHLKCTTDFLCTYYNYAFPGTGTFALRDAPGMADSCYPKELLR